MRPIDRFCQLNHNTLGVGGCVFFALGASRCSHSCVGKCSSGPSAQDYERVEIIYPFAGTNKDELALIQGRSLSRACPSRALMSGVERAWLL